MRRSLPIYAHGIEKLETAAGKLRGAELRASVTLPERRRSTRLEILLAPSLAVAMLDALPYLIEYPYGCTEQTMSRFLPAVITARTLAELGLAREDVVGRVFGGIEPEHAAKTHPRGSRDLDELDAVVRQRARPSGRLAARRRRLRLVEAGSQRSLHDRLRGLGPGPGAGCRSRGGPGDAGEGAPLPGPHPGREEERARHTGVDAPRPRGTPRLQLGAAALPTSREPPSRISSSAERS